MRGYCDGEPSTGGRGGPFRSDEAGGRGESREEGGGRGGGEDAGEVHGHSGEEVAARVHKEARVERSRMGGRGGENGDVVGCPADG